MTYTFYHYTSGDEATFDAESEELAWSLLQDREEVGLDELQEAWYLGHAMDDDGETPLYNDDDEAQESEDCCS